MKLSLTKRIKKLNALIKWSFAARLLIVTMLAALFLAVQPQNNALAVYTIKVFMVRFCDSDGMTDCSTAYEKGLQDQLDITNAIYERSNLPFQFVIHPDTDFNNPVSPLPCMDTNGDGTIDNQDDPCNFDYEATNKCIPSDLTLDTDRDGIINRYDQDVNGDGTKGDGKDKNIICVPVPNHINKLVQYATAYQKMYPDSFIMFSPGYAKEAKWKSGEWVIANKGGQGPFGWDFIYMPSNGGEETLFAHESGHHFGLPHTFADGKNPATIKAAATMIREYVKTNNIDPYDTATAIKVFDGDLTAFAFDADGDGNNDTLYISDTPPDPRSQIIAKLNKDKKCGPNGTFDVPVTYSWDINNDGNIDTSDTVTYQLSPNRNLVMSYFKDCSNFDMIYSGDQAKVISTALFGHTKRKNLVEAQFMGAVWVDFTNNSEDERGTYYHPFNTMSEGVSSVNAGNKILIRSSTTNDTPIILKKNMTIEAYGGVVTIGG